jgi:DICT domain-containing protein
MGTKGKRTFHLLTKEHLPELFNDQEKENDISAYNKKVAAIIARYYYYTTNAVALGIGTTDKVLAKLEEEFFISSYQITQILQKNSSQIQELRNQKPDKNYFKTKWSHLVW